MKKLLFFIAIALVGMTTVAQSPSITMATPNQDNVTATSIDIHYSTTHYCGNGASFVVQRSTSPTFSNIFIDNANSYNHLGFNNVTVARNQTISGLTPNTTYYWRVVGTPIVCSSPVTASPIYSFTTLNSSLPYVQSLGYLTAEYNTASVGYYLGANNDPTTAVVKYGLSATTMTNLATIPGASGLSVSLLTGNLTGLVPDTTYYYQIAATNSNGTVNSVTSSFKTAVVPAPVFFNVGHTVAIGQATINYQINQQNLATNTVINYGTSSSALNNQIAGGSLTATQTNTALSSVVSSLLPLTTYYYQIVATNTAGGTASSAINSFTTPSDGSPLIYNISSNSGALLGEILYAINPAGTITNTVINYGLTSSNMNNQVTGITTLASNIPANATISITGLQQNTTYYYQIVASNTTYTRNSPILSFTTLANNILAYYNFENNTNSSDGVHNLVNMTGTVTYGLGKNGQGVVFDNAQTLVNTTIDSVLNNGEYSIAWWENHIGPTNIYATSYELFGSNYFRKAIGYNIFSNAFSLATSSTTFGPEGAKPAQTNVWEHHALVLKLYPTGRYLTHYKNGVEDGAIVLPLSSSLYHFNNKFTIGGGTNANGTINTGKFFKGTIDDFYVFNRAILPAEINILMNSTTGTLSTQNFQDNTLKATMYPNPASNNFSIETENELKSVEIYSILGQKVLSSTSKIVSVSRLSKGVYMVRIEDINNAVSTQKIILE